jgi:MtrB/PioB family decaheme-associated outer membrane protein
MSHLNLRLIIAALLAGATVPAGAEAPAAAAPAADTSNWKCESCPFLQDYEAEATAGGLYADGATSSFGRWTGIYEDSAYADVSAAGRWRNESGTYARYEIEDLGLDSRSASVEYGREGRFDVTLSYDGLPWNKYDTTRTPYSGGPSLALPSAWVPAGTPANMTELEASLRGRDIQTERRTYGIAARYLAGRGFSFFGGYQRQEKEGTGLTRAAFLLQATELPEVVDYVTDTFEVGTAWSGERASARLAYAGSFFRNLNTALAWDNAYTPLVASAATGRMALTPDNSLQQVLASGHFLLPWWSTTLSWSGAVGSLEQDDALLPVSTAPGATAPAESLDGEIDIANYGLSLAMRPMSKLSVRGSARYDERDDRTDPLTVDYIVTDTVAGGTETTPRYSYERTRLDASADYTVLPWLRIGGALQQDEIDREQQEVASTKETGGTLRARVTRWESLSVTLKGGEFHREASGFDPSLRSPDENPLLRKYNLANRDRDLIELMAAWNASAEVTLALNGRYTDDKYRRSPVGLTDGGTLSIAGNASWAVSEAVSLYFDAGWQEMDSRQVGESNPAGPEWRVENDDEFWNLGIGGRWKLNDKWDLTADLVQAESKGKVTLLTADATDRYPDLTTELSSVRIAADYRWSDTLSVQLQYLWQSYDTRDWALDGVTPAAVPQLLSMGAEADEHDVNLFGLNFTWRFGQKPVPAEE